MNLITAAPIWLAGLLILCLAAAALEDALRLRISNVTCLAVVVAALIAMTVEGFSIALWQNFAVFLALLVLGTVAFSARLMGGGDVKLLAALGLWTNLRSAPWLVAAIFIAGGALAVLYLIGRMFKGSDRGKRQIPYGIAIAAGALILLVAQRPELHKTNPKLPPIKLHATVLH